MKSKSIKFPKDELPHNHTIEWWYFNGHLKDKKGNNYAFMNCLFKANVKKAKIPFLSKVPLGTVYFFHSILSDIKNKKSYSLIDYISVLSKDSFSKPLLFVNHINPLIVKGYTNRVIEETKKFTYHLKDENVDLELTSIKKPLLEGGKGYLKLGSKSTYYYSLTNLKTTGTIKVKDKLIEVEGKSWMDHQWANVAYGKDKWTWFSIQLNNDTEMVCFEFDDGKVKTYLASISYSNDKQEHFSKVKLTPLEMEWMSPKTKAKYPLSWRIEIPSKKIDLKVTPLIKNQEIVFGTINYWEGPLKVKGSFGNQKVNGSGFLELVGYKAKYSNLKFAKDEIENIINKSLSYLEKGTKHIIGTIKTKISKK